MATAQRRQRASAADPRWPDGRGKTTGRCPLPVRRGWARRDARTKWYTCPAEAALGARQARGRTLVHDPDKLVNLVAELRNDGIQVLMATHSPILTATPSAPIIELHDEGVHTRVWEDLMTALAWCALDQGPRDTPHSLKTSLPPPVVQDRDPTPVNRVAHPGVTRQPRPSPTPSCSASRRRVPPRSRRVSLLAQSLLVLGLSTLVLTSS